MFTNGVPVPVAEAPEDTRPLPNRKPKPLAFEVDSTIRVSLHIDLALALGEHLLRYRSQNKAIEALAHQLNKLVPPDDEDDDIEPSNDVDGNHR